MTWTDERALPFQSSDWRWRSFWACRQSQTCASSLRPSVCDAFQPTHFLYFCRPSKNEAIQRELATLYEKRAAIETEISRLEVSKEALVEVRFAIKNGS